VAHDENLICFADVASPPATWLHWLLLVTGNQLLRSDTFLLADMRGSDYEKVLGQQLDEFFARLERESLLQHVLYANAIAFLFGDLTNPFSTNFKDMRWKVILTTL